MAPVIVRAARHEDTPAVAAIYNAGIAGRQATFETRPREADEIGAWFDHGLPFLVAEDGDGRVVGFARVTP
jgi:L-amino acid N-acyltransferase YncA